MKQYVLAAIIGGSLISAAVSGQTTDPCQSYIPAAIGGPMPAANDDRVVLRWLANINYEVDYHGQTFLFDAAYDRAPRNRPLGFTALQVKKADAIFIGHAHFDHMSDAVVRFVSRPAVQNAATRSLSRE